MNATSRLRCSRHAIGLAWIAALLLASSAVAPAADSPSLTVPHSAPKPTRHAFTTNALVALFDRNDAARAAELAGREVARTPRNVDGWFVAMEAAALLNDAPTELRGALRVCKLAQADDPRAAVAAMRLGEFQRNSESLRRERDALELLAQSGGTCADAAVGALYGASLDGLPDADVRHLAQYAGWITQYKLTRKTKAAAVAEKFEFPDGRIVIPDYLPRAATYIAEAEFKAAGGSYAVSGDLTGARVSLDENEVKADPVLLAAGMHQVKVVFSAAEATPRIRITLAPSKDNGDWAAFRFPPRETIYLRAAAALAAGDFNLAAQQIRSTELATTAIGQKLVSEAAQRSANSADTAKAASPNSCETIRMALTNSDTHTDAGQLSSCAPDSLAYAQWLVAGDRHSEAIRELRRVLYDWPLDRAAHSMLISELQHVGDHLGADRAAAAFLAIAPNARDFRRMAQSAAQNLADASAPFYQAYRRPVPAAISPEGVDAPAVILLQDKVAVARPDGSISLYMHRAVQLLTAVGAEQFRPLALPAGGEWLSTPSASRPQAGSVVEEEYVVNYTGDAGMTAHPEVFQYVFNDFDFPLLDARFVVLSPAAESPGYVIASGNVPESRLEYANGMRAQIWEKQLTVAAAAESDPAIVRVVENENGWSVPPSVERRRILETIHPGPRPREA